MKSLQATADSSYAVQEATSPAPALGIAQQTAGDVVHFRASNPAHGMSMDFTGRGVRARRQTQSRSESLSLRLAAWGRKGEPSQSTAPSSVPTQVGTHRVAYAHGPALTEWYLNGPAGFEQGFTITQPPSGAGALHFDVAADQPGTLLEQDGQTVQLRDSRSRVVGRYGDAFAEDATGQLLPTELSLVDGHIRVSVDDSRATYPLVVDPMIWLLEASLSPMLPGAAVHSDDWLGFSLDMDGGTLVAGAPGSGAVWARTGATFVYRKRADGQWLAEQQLTAEADAKDGDLFGHAVAVSGTTIAIGAPYDDNGATLDVGSVCIFVQSKGIWQRQARLVPPDGIADGLFGFSVSLEGDVLVVGSPGDDDNGAGSGTAYVYQRSGGTWSLQTKLVAKLLSGANEKSHDFGQSVSVYGSGIAVGASNTAYVYQKDSTNAAWLPRARYVAPAQASGFGATVAMDRDTVVVGTDPTPFATSGYELSFHIGGGSSFVYSLESSALQATLSGARAVVDGDRIVTAYFYYDDGYGYLRLYERSGTTWKESAVINPALPNKPDVYSVPGAYDFGWSVALDGNDLAVSSATTPNPAVLNDSLFMYRDAGPNAQPLGQLFGSAPSYDSNAGVGFGFSVAISDQTVVIGGSENKVLDVDAAYVFVRTAGDWQPQARLLPSDGTGDRFAHSVDISGDTAVVGTRFGAAAYVFVRSGSTWSQQAKLVPDAGIGSTFGSSVAIDGNTIIVGVPEDSAQGGTGGSAYVFVRSGTTWSKQTKLHPADVASADYFGFSVDITGDTIAVGASGHDAAANNAGAVYVFTRASGTWSAPTKLTAADAAASDSFGLRVALSGDTLVSHLMRTNLAYVYVRDGVAWTEQAKLSTTRAFALDADSLLTASSVYRRTGTTWTSQPGPAFPTPEASSVALDGDTAVLGGGTNILGGVPRASVYSFASSRAIGESCKASVECEMGNCVDGVCCDSECDGACEACAKELTGASDGTCTNLPTGTLCGPSPQSCVSKELYQLAPRCSASGECESQQVACVGGYACIQGPTVGACKQACADHPDCVDAHWCDPSGVCIPDRKVGQGCEQDEQCLSGKCTNGKCLGAPGDPCTDATQCGLAFCADGVCCTSSCSTNPCEACNLPGKAGTCSVAPKGAPVGARQCQAANPQCGSGACDGSSSVNCTFDEGAPCGDTVCSNGSINGALCTKSGTCIENGNKSCGAYVCANGTACRDECTSHKHCAQGFQCNSETHTCTGSLELGEACATSEQCDSGYCSDGVCCNESCSGQCEACDVADKPGVCTAVSGEPHGARPPCNPGDHAACGASCDGGRRDGCKFPDQGTPCEAASCSADAVLSPAQACDGAGSCALKKTQICYPFACNEADSSCAETCQSNDDCAAGAVCDTTKQQCAPSEAVCGSSSTLLRADGSQQACSPYVCEAGECRRDCRRNADCLEGFSCEDESCVEESTGDNQGGAGTTEPPGSKTDSGCGCRTASSPGSDTPLGLVGLMALGLLARRRPRSSPRFQGLS